MEYLGEEYFSDEEQEFQDDNVFELPFKPPDWQNSLGFFLPLPTPKPAETRKVEFYELPDLPPLDWPKPTWRELVGLLGSGGPSSRAIAEKMHRMKTMDSAIPEEVLDAAAGEVTLADSRKATEKKLKQALTASQTKLLDTQRVLADTVEEKEKAVEENALLAEEVEKLKAELRLMGLKPPTSTSRSRQGREKKKNSSGEGGDSEEHRKMLKKKAAQLVKKLDGP